VVVLEVRLFTALEGLGIYIDGRSDDILIISIFLLKEHLERKQKLKTASGEDECVMYTKESIV
jgi:hypothetical protein